MTQFERILNISASVCSLFAFTVLIFEKTGIDNLKLYRLIGYFVFSVFFIATTMIFTYIVKFWYKLFFETKQYLKMGFGLLIAIILFFLFVYVVKCGTFLIELTDSFLSADF